METQLTTIIRDENRQPRGTAVVVRNGDEITYGYALLNTNSDKYNKKTGVKIALARASAINGYNLPKVIEREKLVLDAYARLEDRAIRYFQDLSPDLIKIESIVDIVEE